MKLWERIEEDHLWSELEQIAIHTVVAGGNASMGYYRGAWFEQVSLEGGMKNPSTMADIQATATILRMCDSLLSPMAGKLNCALSYLGEETGKRELRQNITDKIDRRIHNPNRFFSNHENVMRVIFDGIDGTSNFDRGFPIFCSALAILIDDQVRVSATYNPIHHEVYSAILMGPYDAPDSRSSASAWRIATGNRVNLADAAKKAEIRNLKQESVGIHLTRSHPDKLHEFLDSTAHFPRKSLLERIALASGSVYALNSGIVAMTEVAKGSLGGFVNIITNPWDVAAGEALVRACGGTVTDFENQAIRYTSANPISVIAAKEHLHPTIFNILAA